MSVGVLNLIEVIINGLMVGVLYSLVALGFVLIFKASGIFNYAQGVLALFAALTLVGLQTGQVPFAHLISVATGHEVSHFGWTLPAIAAFALTGLVMVGLAFLVERLLLRHLVNQEPIILFMATIGLAYFLEGLGDLMWGADVKAVEVGLPSGGSLWFEELTKGWAPADSGYWGMYIDRLDIVAGLVAAVLVAGLTLFSQVTKTGRALRAVADDHQAALSVGISLRTIWVITWSIAGLVALVAGVMWGAKSGRAVLAVPDRAQGAAGADPRRLHLDPRRHRRRADHRRRREAVRVLHRTDDRRRHRELVRLRARAGLPDVPPAGPVRGADHRAGVRCYA